jgi:hypothetical protein
LRTFSSAKRDPSFADIEGAFISPCRRWARKSMVLLCRLTDLWVALIGAALLGSYFLGLAVRQRVRVAHAGTGSARDDPV